MEDIGTLGGTFSGADGINAAGTLVGWSTLIDDSHAHAFIYSKGEMTDIGTLGGNSSTATGINSAGQVTGFSTLQGDRITRAFLYVKGRMHDIGTLGGTQSAAYAINSAGQITGDSRLTGDTATHAFLYDKGKNEGSRGARRGHQLRETPSTPPDRWSASPTCRFPSPQAMYRTHFSTAAA